MAYGRKRADQNQTAIVQALRAAGCTVAILAGVGGGVPDLLVGWRGQNFLLEVKNPAGRGDRLTPAESDFLATWRGQAVIVRDVGEALTIITPPIPSGEGKETCNFQNVHHNTPQGSSVGPLGRP